MRSLASSRSLAMANASSHPCHPLPPPSRGAIMNSRFTSPLLLSHFPLTQPHFSFCSSYSPLHQHPTPRGTINPPLSSATEEGELVQEEEEEQLELDKEVEVDPTAEVRYLDPEAEAERITEWEVDFCSRPIFDERGKKVWELVVCDATLSLQFTRYFPNNVINSVTLKDAIADISSSLNLPLPVKIRFFRSQMQTIITKACNELGIKPIPSKRVCNSYSSSLMYLTLPYLSSLHFSLPVILPPVNTVIMDTIC